MKTKHKLVEDYIITWLKVNLKNEEIQVETDLRCLDFDSFDLVRLTSDLEHEFNVYIDFKEIFEIQTIRNIVDLVVDGNRKNRMKVIPQDMEKYPLTEQQLAIYIASVKDKGTCLYNIPLKLRLPKSIDLKKLRACLVKLIHNHWELNVKLIDASENMYFIYDSERIRIEKYTDQEVDTFFRPFDLLNPPLARVGLSDTYLLMDIHHIIADGRSYRVLIAELDNLYQGKKINKPVLSYADYAKTVQESILKGGFDKAIKHFSETLKNCNGISFGAENENNVHCGKSNLYYLDQETKQISSLIKNKFKLTNTMLFFAAFCILLKKYTNQDNIVTSLTLMNRKNKDFMDVIGMFVNTLPIRIPDIDDMSYFLELIRNEVINLYNYQEVPLMEAIKNADIRSSSINTSFIYQGQGINKFYFNNEICRAEWVEVNVAKFDLTFEVTEEVQGYTLRIEYKQDKISENIVELMQKSYKMIIEQMYACNKLSKIRIYDKNNYQQIIDMQRKNKVSVNLSKCVHQIFSEIAQNNYEKAIVFEGCYVTYQELEQYSNSLAYELQSKEEMRLGIIIPIIADRSWKVIAAMLGILKAGGAYLLIERSCPQERLNKIFSDIGACIIVTENYVVNEQYINIRLEETNVWQNIYKPNIYTPPNGLCYVIYTSGSTGIPKGIKISHKNVINYCSKNEYSIWGKCFSRGEKRLFL